VATYTNSVIPTTRQGYFLKLTWKECIPIPSPPVVVRFEKELSAEEVEKLKGLGASVFAQKGKGSEMYSFGSEAVDADLIGQLLRHTKKCEQFNPVPNGAINIGTFTQFLRVLGIVTMFLKTQTYPAFQTQPIDDEDFGRFDSIEGLLKRKVTLQSGGLAKRTHVEGVANEEDADADVDMEDCVEDFATGQGDSSVPVAKPSQPVDVYYGGPTELPALPGLSFPYFQGMIAQDTNFVSSVVREYFLFCLGDEQDSIISAHKKIKGALGAIAFSETGQILQHVFLGIQLAIQGQARLFPFIKDGKYLGFALLGGGFKLSIDGYVRSPVPHVELLATVSKMDEHRVAVGEIIMKLAKMKLISTKRMPSKTWAKEAMETASSNPRELVERIKELTLDDETREEIEKLANRLSYPQRFLDFSSTNILYAVDLLVSGEWPPLDKPMFTRGGTITALTPELSVFAMFGDTSFSFRTVGGSARMIPSEWKDDMLFKPYMGKNGKEVVPNPPVILSKKSLGMCVSDWRDLLLARQILMKSSRDQAFRSIVFGGKLAKEFWKGFVDRVGPLMKPNVEAGTNADLVELGQEVVDADDDQLSLADLL